MYVLCIALHFMHGSSYPVKYVGAVGPLCTDSESGAQISIGLGAY